MLRAKAPYPENGPLVSHMLNCYRGDELEPEGRLGRVEAYLKSTVEQAQEALGAQSQVTPRLQQAKGDVRQRANAIWEGLPEQASFLDQLKQDVSYLQQVIEDLGSRLILAVRMFQLEAPVLLSVEAFVFNLPPQPSSFVG